MSNSKQIINTTKAPPPIGPYSQAVQFGNLLFLSGQISINPATNETISGSLTDETRQVMHNIREVLHHAGLSMDSIIKTSIFLTDMAYFSEVNIEYSKYFNSNFPARETVQVSGLPKGVRVEISIIAGID
jgi:2-iminobutanoate/2-iminopropanoate deaminase